MHDSRVLKNSPVYLSRSYPPPGFFILGDGGYPCLKEPICYITAFKEVLHGIVEGRFNQHHARARSIIERAVGMLKNCWRAIFLQSLMVHHTFGCQKLSQCVRCYTTCAWLQEIRRIQCIQRQMKLRTGQLVRRAMARTSDHQHRCQHQPTHS